MQLKAADDTLRRYECTLLDALFDGRSAVKLSELKQTFAADLAAVQDQLYDEMLYNRWFRRRPDITRTTWFTFGIVLAGVGVALTVLLAKESRFGWTGVAVTLTGLTLLVSGRYMPAHRAGERGARAGARLPGVHPYGGG